MNIPDEQDWPSSDYADFPALINLGFAEDIARQVLNASPLTGHGGRKVVEVDRIDDALWALGIQDF
jgi:hypothetical protein